MQLRDHRKKNYASYRTRIPFAREPRFPNVLLITTYLLSFSLHTVIPSSLSTPIELASSDARRDYSNWQKSPWEANTSSGRAVINERALKID